MDELKQLVQIDWWYVFIAVVIIFVAVKYVWSLVEWFIGKLGIETKKMKQKRQESEQLKAVTELAKTTAESLGKLQSRCIKDEDEFRKNLNDYIQESRADRKALHDEMTAYSTNRINDRKQSMEIQRDWNNAQNEITNKVNDISEKLDKMEEKENKRVQSEIKERIAQSYREYKKTKTIASEELEALEDLIETYENHGGENSFVHSLVQKEMYTWEVE